jgi:hypothetical protein
MLMHRQGRVYAFATVAMSPVKETLRLPLFPVVLVPFFLARAIAAVVDVHGGAM